MHEPSGRATQDPGLGPASKRIERREVTILVLCVGALILGMVIFVVYPYPSGERPSVLDFVAFWFRELLIVVVLAVALLWAGISRLVKGRRRNDERKKHAP